MSYVRAAEELPLLSVEEAEEYAVRYGFVLADAEDKGAVRERRVGSSDA